MTANDLLRLLAQTNLALAAGVILVVLARRWVRGLFGAAAAYGLWLLPALAAVAVALPPRTVEVAAQQAVASPVRIAVLSELPELPAPAIESLAAAPGPDMATVALWGWIAGAVAMSLWLAARQLQFMREVARGRAGPAVVGFLRPRIVLPAHFETGFTRREQLVVLAHERTHLSRGDAQLNGLVALVRCLCWFNPLAHVGAHLMRVDQELACDASVIARYPKSRAPYAQALLKAELAARPLPLGCYWPARAAHPLTERMAMLQRDPLPRRRRLAGAIGVGALAAVAGTAAWAARPPEVVMSTAAPRSTTALPEPDGARAPGPTGRRPAMLASARTVPAPRPDAVGAPEPQGRADPLTLALLAAAPPAAAPSARPPTDIAPVVVTPAPKTSQPVDATFDMSSDGDTLGNYGVSMWPANAYQVRDSGAVTLTCWINVEGLAEWCRVASERPARKGFGEAAKAMRPNIKVDPRKGPDGKPVAGLMNIGMTYRAPDPQSGRNPLPNTRITLLNDPVWAKAPTFEAVERAYPETGGGANGFAVAHCRVRGDGRLSGCRPATESPRKQGFGAAAVKLAADFRVEPRTLPATTGGEPLEVEVPIRFAPPGAARTVSAASWLQGFDTKGAPKIFPPEAAAKGLTSGRGVARCVVGAGGGLTACAPDGGDAEGFADVAAKLAGAMRMNLWSADARPVEGATVYVGVRLNLKGGS